MAPTIYRAKCLIVSMSGPVVLVMARLIIALNVGVVGSQQVQLDKH
jgi:hypothetical protein